MKKHLYETFQHWYQKNGQIYFYSDPHFSNLEGYKMRLAKKGITLEVVDPKATTDMFDEMQVENINKKVHKNDTLIILGDIDNVEWVSKLKAGYKVLIMGNHDKGASNYKRIETWTELGDEETADDVVELLNKRYAHYDNKLFDEVYEGTLQIGPKIILSHEPVDYPYCFNIHGHDHNINPLGGYTEKLDENLQPCGGWYNCCAEQNEYKPVSFKDLVNSGILKNVPDIHRVTIEKAKK